MTYTQTQNLLVQDFGVMKAKRQRAAMNNNQVTDEGVTNVEGRGTRDDSILLKAKEMEKNALDLKKAGDGASGKRKAAYSKESVLPEEILALIPYKETYQALESGNHEELSRLLSSFARISMQNAYRGFDHIQQKREKKNIMKAHVYLDALISLHRMPTHITKPLDVLSEQIFKGLSIEALRLILEKFGQKQELEKRDFQGKKG